MTKQQIIINVLLKNSIQIGVKEIINAHPGMGKLKINPGFVSQNLKVKMIVILMNLTTIIIQINLNVIIIVIIVDINAL